MSTPPKRLGRGLGSIIAGSSQSGADVPSPQVPHPLIQDTVEIKAGVSDGGAATKVAASSVLGFMEVAIGLVDPSPYQMRREFDESGLQELAESIRSEGLINPITVRRKDQRFELIAGERRFRACKLIALKTVTARVIEAADTSAAVMALIENLQRQDLNPIDEALGYASLMEDFKLTQEAVAERIGKGRANVANYMRLLRLNKECQGYVSKNLLSFGHARALLGIEGQDQQTLLARRIIEAGMSVRDTEAQVNRWKSQSGKTTPNRTAKQAEAENAVVKSIEQKIASHFNTIVQLKHTPKKGTLTIEYYGNDDLQRILEKLGIEA